MPDVRRSQHCNPRKAVQTGGVGREGRCRKTGWGTVGQPVAMRDGDDGCVRYAKSLGLHRQHLQDTMFSPWELANSITEVFEILSKAIPVTSLFLSYMEPLCRVSRGKTGEADTGKVS